MSKAILVINMPERCMGCIEAEAVEKEKRWYCKANGETIENMDIMPNWCPLMPKPQKLEPATHLNNLDKSSFNIGWNACVDALEGKT
ncbi:MAG: hypothetical protein LUD72_09090 [Bacteroidales bacterium]|nr:hypothetical protein [Bacteroidales bacterium]